ncbi:signal peptidase II [candidate division KSB1 bacterium]|nr:signal peptidase II [candidate division KSB1 bacterium]
MRNYRILWIPCVVIVLDQISKHIIKYSMKLYDSFNVMGDFFRITYVENSGMAFGIKFGHSYFFTVFAIIASVAILVYLFKMKKEFYWARLAMALIFGGAIGNLVDRIIRGSVVDFLDFEFFNIDIPSFEFFFVRFPGYSMDRWPVFNVADVAVTLGMFILIVFVALEKESNLLESDDTEVEMVR